MNRRIALVAAAGAALITFSALPATAATGDQTSQSVAQSQSTLKWVRGTAVNIVNQTGQSVQIGTASNTWDRVPQVDQHSLANGATETASQGRESATGTSVLSQVTFSDGQTVQFAAFNPAIGNPVIQVRDGGFGVLDWQNAPYESHKFDEGESWSTTINGHKITFERNSDDSQGHSDSKVWTITLH